MRLLYVCLDPGVPLGSPKGAAVHVDETLRALAAEGHEAAVLAHSKAEGYAPPCPARLAASREPAPAVRRAIERFRPDVVYERYALGHLEGRREAWAAGIPLMLEVNAPLVEETERFRGVRLGAAAREAERHAWTSADLVVAPSERLAEMVRSAGHRRVLVVPNAVDPDRFEPADDGAPVRRRLGLDGRFVVAWAGRLKGWHDPDTLVDAVAALPRRLRPALLLIGDGPERSCIEGRAAERGLTTVTTGAVGHGRVPGLLAAADACVATLPADPSLHYFSPLKALEYLAAGRATVVATAGALTALVEEGAALGYRPGDPADLATRLSAIADDAALRRRLAGRGRSYAEGRTWRAAARAIAGAAEALLPAEGASVPDAREASRDPHVGYVLKRFPCLSETFVAEELIELQRRGVPLTVFAMGRPEEPFVQGFVEELSVPVVYLPYRVWQEPIRVARAVRRVLRSSPQPWLGAAAASVRRMRLFGWRRLMQATVLRDETARAGIQHMHVHFANKAARLADLTHRMGGPTYSVTAHAKDIYHRQVRARDLREILGGAQFVATVSEENRRHLASVLEGRGSVHLVSNSVDLERLGHPGARRPEPALVLAVARLIEKKGLLDLIRACAVLAEESVPVRLELIGDGPLRQELEAAAARTGIDARFLGSLPREEVVRHYRRATVFCLPSTVASSGDRDGLPTSVLEAMALGVPVVTTSLNGLAEAVIDERTGLAVPERSPVDLAAAIRRLLSDPELAARLSREARRHVEARFSLANSASRLRSLFAEVG